MINIIIIVAIITLKSQTYVVGIPWPYNSIRVDTNVIEIVERLEPLSAIFLLLFVLSKNIKYLTSQK